MREAILPRREDAKREPVCFAAESLSRAREAPAWPPLAIRAARETHQPRPLPLTATPRNRTELSNGASLCGGGEKGDGVGVEGARGGG